MLVDDPVDALDNIGITFMILWDPVIGRPRQSDAATTALHGQLMLGNQVSHGVAFLSRP